MGHSILYFLHNSIFHILFNSNNILWLAEFTVAWFICIQPLALQLPFTEIWFKRAASTFCPSGVYGVSQCLHCPLYENVRLLNVLCALSFLSGSFLSFMVYSLSHLLFFSPGLRSDLHFFWPAMALISSNTLGDTWLYPVFYLSPSISWIMSFQNY